jgi:hypothetical protein
MGHWRKRFVANFWMRSQWALRAANLEIRDVKDRYDATGATRQILGLSRCLLRPPRSKCEASRFYGNPIRRVRCGSSLIQLLVRSPLKQMR